MAAIYFRPRIRPLRHTGAAIFVFLVVGSCVAATLGCGSSKRSTKVQVASTPAVTAAIPEQDQLPFSMDVSERQLSEPAMQDGLLLTIALEKKVYRVGEEITLHFELRNVSENEMFIGDGFLAPGYHEVGGGSHFDLLVTADDAKDLTFFSGTATEGHTSGIRKVFKLAPNAAYSGIIRIFRERSKSLSHLERGGTLDDSLTGATHRLGIDATRYCVVLRYRADPRTHSVHKPPADFSDELLWKGIVDSESLTFEVNSDGGSLRADSEAPRAPGTENENAARRSQAAIKNGDDVPWISNVPFPPEKAKVEKQFAIGDYVSIGGNEFLPNARMTAYVEPHKPGGWNDGDPLAANAIASGTVASDKDGTVSLTRIWRADRSGSFDIVIDYDSDGKFSSTLDGLSGLRVKSK